MKRLLLLCLATLVGGCQATVLPNGSAVMNSQPSPLPSAPMNVNEWAAASRLLTRSADLVRERGFQQGAVVPVASVCMATALERAFEEGGYSIVDFNYAREALARVLDVPREPVVIAGDPLDVPYWGRDLMDWNDTPGRTGQDAIAAFEKAARTAIELREAALNRAN